MNQLKIARQTKNIHHLDAATQEIIRRINKNDRRLLISGFMTLLVLFTVGIFSIYKQTQIAKSNQDHIDCIVKLLATPLPDNKTHKLITDPSNTCNISFTP